MAKADIIKEFTKIKGIGKAKAELLYDKGFDSLEKLKKAKVQDLSKIEGISESDAKNIKGQFKEETKKPKKEIVKEKAPKKEKIAEPKKKETEEKTEEKKDEKEEEKPEEKEEKKYVVKKKPTLTKEQKVTLRLRKEIKARTPEFIREEWFRYKRIPRNWRRPDGITSKMRINLSYRPSKVRIGFRGPKETRGLHSSGFQEVVVNNVYDLQNINPKTQAARIGGSVGTKKRIDIEKKAEELEIRILNIS